MMTTVASTGLPRASPPSRANASWPVVCATQPASRNSAADSRPWLTIWNAAPVAPWSLSAKMPSVTRPIWPIDE